MAKTPSERPTYRITLEARQGGSPAAVRLRMALKCLLRSFGLVCRECVEVKPAEPPAEEQA